MAAKLLVLGCKTMREGVAVSAVFLVGAIALFLAARYVVPADVLYIQLIVLFLALVLIILAPVILISTFLLSVIPGGRENLDKCEH
jgi:hypothetical protein